MLLHSINQPNFLSSKTFVDDLSCWTILSDAIIMSVLNKQTANILLSNQLDHSCLATVSIYERMCPLG